MHDYAVFEHDRTAVGRWLGVASILASSGVGQVGGWLAGLSGFDLFTRATLTTGVAYFLLHLFVDRKVWKSFAGVPDINGSYKVTGQTLNEDGTTRFDWEAKLGIEQTWNKICVTLETKNSKSASYTATISKRSGPTGGWLLSYSYRNEPHLEQIHELSPHKGYCEIELDSVLKVGRGSYFNSGGRRTYGIMTLVKEVAGD